MFNNPLIKRYRLSAMRPTQVIIYITIYIVILFLMGMITSKISESFEQLYKSLYFQLFFIQAMFLLAWSAFNSSSAIKEEILSNSYDFFKMLPLSACEKTTGILMGKNLFVLILAAINFALMSFFGIIGHIPILLQLQIICVTLAISLLINSIALLNSIRPDIKKGQSGIVIIVGMMFFFVPMIVNAVIAIHQSENLESFGVYFYNFKIPLMWLISLIALYYACWAIKGCLRKFTYERSPLFTPAGALAFMIGYGVIILGLFYNGLLTNLEESVRYAFWIACFAPVFIIPFASRKSFESYIEFLGAKHLSSPGGGLALPMLCNSNLATNLVLYIIWALFCLATGFIVKSDYKFDLALIAVFFASYMFLALMFELFNVISPSIKKIGILLSFIVGLYVFLPLILAGIFDNESIIKYSPFGVMALLLDSKEIYYEFIVISAVYNIAISLLPALFIARKYSYIITARKKM